MRLEWSPDNMCLGHSWQQSYTRLYSFPLPFCPLFYPQRIQGSQVSPGLQYFGQSLSGGQDLTMDGLVDLAIGAQGRVMLLRWELLLEDTKYLPFKEWLCCLKASDGPLVSLQIPACAEPWGDHGVHTQGSGKECVWVPWKGRERPDCWRGQSLPPCPQEHKGSARRRWGWVGKSERVKWLETLMGGPLQSFQPSSSSEQTSRQAPTAFPKRGWSEQAFLWLGGEAQQTPPKSEYVALPHSLSSPEKQWPHTCELTRIFLSSRDNSFTKHSDMHFITANLTFSLSLFWKSNIVLGVEE